MLASTKRIWKLDETSIFKGMLVIFLMQYFLGVGLYFFNVASEVVYAGDDLHDEQGVGTWFDGSFFALNTAIFLVLLLVLRLQEKHYEIDDAEEEEVLRVINWLPIRFFSVSATYPLSQLQDVAQVLRKGEACVSALFVGPRGEKSVILNPDDQEDLTRALSAYLPRDHPNRGLDGISHVYTEENWESDSRPWPCALVMSKQSAPILSSPAIEARWSQIQTYMGASFVWLLSVAFVTSAVNSIGLDYESRVELWLGLLVLSSLVCALSAGLWNMGNVAEYRVHRSKLQVASSLPFVCTEDHLLKYMSTVNVVSVAEVLRLLGDEERQGRVFVLGDLPCADAAGRRSGVYIKRKAGLLDLVILPDRDPTGFAEVLSRQAAADHHQMMA